MVEKITQRMSRRFRSPKQISFCITCKNRLAQISETLPRNLNDNYCDRRFLEFVLVDFGSTDGLQCWIMDNFRDSIKEGYLKYIFTDELSNWHMSIAKNTAHLFASGEIVVNLDCDNYTGQSGGKFVKKCFAKYKNEIVLHQFSGTWRDGSCGRISLRKSTFCRIGGYNESFEPMGHQDIDLLWRLQRDGVQYVSDPSREYNQAIKNSKEESVKFCSSDLSWEEMAIKNRKASALNVASNQIIANQGIFGVRKNIFLYDGADFTQLT